MYKANWPASGASLILLLALSSCGVGELEEFTSDGCSSFPDGTLEQRRLWRSCCVVHDVAYWKGGSRVERSAADEALRACVARTGEPQVAELMLAGVRVGGTPWLPTRFRWGYGWPFLRGYKTLTASEAALVEKKLAAARVLLQDEGAIEKKGPKKGPDTISAFDR